MQGSTWNINEIMKENVFWVFLWSWKVPEYVGIFRNMLEFCHWFQEFMASRIFRKLHYFFFSKKNYIVIIQFNKYISYIVGYYYNIYGIITEGS